MSSLEDLPFTCECPEAMRRACKAEGYFGEDDGKRYCVLHFPSSDKKQAFDAAVERKLTAKDFNYQGVWFPTGGWFSGLDIPETADFTCATFDGGGSFRKTVFKQFAHFDHATFMGRTALSGADFDSAVFAGPAYFGHATFKAGARFDYTTFSKEVSFTEASFEGIVGFRKAKFEESVDFWRCTFVKLREGDWVQFDEAVFNGHANFSSVKFGSKTWFRATKFAGVTFGGSCFAEEAVFQDASFAGVWFVGVEFNNQANFFSTTFKGQAYFSSASFKALTRFTLATFWGDTLFLSASFSGATDFSNAVFKDYVKFSAVYGRGGFTDHASCDFQHTRFERSERVSFHSMTLRPHWFLNIDPRKFEFVGVTWVGNLARNVIDSEVQALEEREEMRAEEVSRRKEERRRNAQMTGDEYTLEEVEKDETEEAQLTLNEPNKRNVSLYRLLSIACRQLAVNAEENHRYDEASDFRFWSMELRRKEGWRARGRLSVSILHTLYRHLSGYGEEIGRAFAMLVGLWLVFTFLYTQVGFVQAVASDVETRTTDTVGMPLKGNKEALAYSLATMTLQKPEPRPLTFAAKFAVLAETIFGPIQAALFALAVRRRFMR